MDSRNHTSKGSVCVCLLSLVVFGFGLVVGVFIGIYLYHGGLTDVSPDCTFKSSFPQDNSTPSIITHIHSNITSKVGEVFSTKMLTAPPTTCNICIGRNPLLTQDEVDVFDPLSDKEMEETVELLIQMEIISPRKILQRLTSKYLSFLSGKAQHTSIKYIQTMFLDPPSKKDALLYLDNGGQKPERFAEVHVIRARVTDPDCMVYKVGPLGKGGADVMQMSTDGEIHINSRPMNYPDYVAVTFYLSTIPTTLNPLFQASFDGATFPADLYVYVMNSPFGLQPQERSVRFTIHFKGLGNKEYHDVFHSLPVHGLLHTPTLNQSDWYATDFYYLKQGPYDTPEDLLHAYRTDHNFRKVILPKEYRKTLYDKVFPKRQNTNESRKYSNISASRSYEPSGSRYSIKNKKVSWMGWEFFVSGNQLKGPSLFDIRFKGERIVYELALNDVGEIGAADNFGQNSLISLSATYGMMEGTVIRDLDCPNHGTIINITVWDHISSASRSLSIVCVFEADGQEASWRHRGYTFAAGLRSRYLLIRFPLSMGHYDHIIEYQFFYDGKVTTKVKTSGRVHGHFWDENDVPAGSDKTDGPFGYRVSDYHTSPIYDHTFGFKVDIDILDSNNTFELVHWKTGTILDAFNTRGNMTKIPEFYLFNRTRYLKWEKVKTERGLKLSYKNQALWTIVNERKANKWKVNRGYQIIPRETCAQTFDDSFLPVKALSFTKYHCAVTRHKDEEQFLTSQYDLNRLADPRDYFDKMLNNESIVDRDLIMWVSVGFAHIPTSEDIPIFTNIDVGFTLKPHNFFDRTASFDMPQFTQSMDEELREREPEYKPCYENR